jgi:inorganic phosphate transporter, PiT family
MHNTLLLIVVVASALAFDFTNGFHDTANVVATSISTRALTPRLAVAVAALLNFVGAFLSLQVAATIGKGIVEAGQITLAIVFAGLIGAIAWNLLTWYLGLPSSSSHALIGGVVGAMLVAVGPAGVSVEGLVAKVLVPALLAPLLAFFVAGLSILIVYRIVGRRPPGLVNRGFRLGQLGGGGLLALAHGTNDAQKTMGVITLALIANGNLSAEDFHVPQWVVIAAGSAIALGTYTGGQRIIKTMGQRIIKMDTAQGFTSQGAGAAVILASSHFGYPLSTTHVISGGIMGSGAAKRLSAVRWGVAGDMALAWVLTIPAAAAMGAAVYGITRIFGDGSVGPFLVAVLALAILAVAFVRRSRIITAEPRVTASA